jgi:hypothetical protein
MEEKKKKFVKPEVEIIQFSNEDIIVTSLGNGGDEVEQAFSRAEDENYGG